MYSQPREFRDYADLAHRLNLIDDRQKQAMLAAGEPPRVLPALIRMRGNLYRRPIGVTEIN